MIAKPKPGYYTVGNQVFYSKSLALIEATKTGIHPTWHYGDQEFGFLDWTSAPVPDITELYRARARQLREKYDYLVLSYSGGSDSTTILQSFLRAGQHLDEVLVKWPVKATEKLYTPSTENRPENVLSEWDFCIQPALDYIAKYFPKTKITVYDWSDDLDSELVEDDWFSINDHMNPGVFRKYEAAVATETEQRMIDSGKSVATIWGIDKPQLAYRDGYVYAYFLDKLVNTRFIDGSANRVSELFFWTTDMPELAMNQAKLVYEYFVHNPDKLKLIDWNTRSTNDKTQYNDIVRKIIYPDWNPDIFQAGKASSMVYNEYDTWMFTELKDYRYYQSWEHGLKSIQKAVNPKYFQVSKSGRFDGWVGFISPFYCLGPAQTVDKFL